MKLPSLGSALIGFVAVGTKGFTSAQQVPSPFGNGCNQLQDVSVRGVSSINDNWFRNEALLNTTSVAPGKFGYKGFLPLDGSTAGQPLTLSNYTMPDGLGHDVLIQATHNNTVYAYDIGNITNAGNSTTPLWQTSLGQPINGSRLNFGTPGAALGVLSTPLADRCSQKLYAVSALNTSSLRTASDVGYFFNMLNLTTGAHLPGSPRMISAATFGTAPTSQSGLLGFSPLEQIQRPSLAMSQGIVYVGFGSHNDDRPYNGLVIGFNGSTGNQLESAYWPCPNNDGCSTWMSGAKPMVIEVSGEVFYTFSNGFDDPPVPGSATESAVKLRFGNDSNLIQTGEYTPSIYMELDATDGDFGSSSSMTLDNLTQAISCGKSGYCYTYPLGNLGGLAANGANGTQILQPSTQNIFTTPTGWFAPGGQGLIYFAPQNETIRAYAFGNAGASLGPVFNSTIPAPPASDQGFILALSSNGSQAGSGVVWGLGQDYVYNQTSGQPITSRGVLSAFNAESLQLLWNSTMNATDDFWGIESHFAPVTVFKGKTFVPTASGKVAIFSLT